MTKHINEQRDMLAKKADDFAEYHSLPDGTMTPRNQSIYEGMLAAVKAMSGRDFTTQAELNANPPKPAGGKKTGEKLVDEKGRVRRALAGGESFTEAVLENADAFGVTSEQQKYAADGLSVGGYLAAVINGPQSSAERWALSETNSTGGGYTVPTILAAGIIDLFRRRMVLDRAGAQTIPLEGANHRFARITAGSTPSWRREGVAVAESEPVFGAIEFQPRSLSVVCKATRELLQDSPNMAAIIEDCLSRDMAVEVDRVGLLGDGVQEPLGLRNDTLTGINEVTGIGALTNYTDFIDGIKLLLDDNVPDSTAAIISNREWATLAKLEDSTHQPMMIPPAVQNLPFIPSGALPTTLGGGTESLAFMGYFPDVVLGYRSQITISALNELYAANGYVGFIAHLRMDVGLLRGQSLCRLLGITP